MVTFHRETLVPCPMDVGVDIGVRRIALGWPERKRSEAVDLGKKVGIRHKELQALTCWMGLQLPAEVNLWIEQPYLSNGPGANQTTTIKMAELVGAIKVAHPWYQVILVGQSTWKAQVCGNGRAEKDEVALWLSVNHPDLYAKCVMDQDQIDAMCIGLYGMMRTSGQVQPPVKAKKKRKRKVPDASAT